MTNIESFLVTFEANVILRQLFEITLSLKSTTTYNQV